ncbi:hypothetical protein [Polaromonas sp. JS666]|uniref:hypothetical protein n=1 Tax=Polaromonas sp. (strain JS666 / ATCC BAA-500) TaxID=296591 RepID=UPI0000464D12|nr:hypothetical protein [Polaromonas sp. JS666]ABE45402.1 conserved hypothetical transmembrane protein [Polaromonas sp. JS666]
MIWNRRTRLITVLFALVSLLFMQLAVASYACPGAASTVAEVAAMADARMPCAEPMSLNMDDTQPNLCQAHCQTGQQTADKYEFPSPVAISALPSDFTSPPIGPVFSGAPLLVPDLKRTTAPPVAIRNCCFRI